MKIQPEKFYNGEVDNRYYYLPPRRRIFRRFFVGDKVDDEIKKSKELLKAAPKEIKDVFDLLEKHKMDKAYRASAYQLLLKMTKKPPETEKQKLKYAQNLLLLKNNIPEMERLAYETSLRGILTDTWKLTAQKIDDIAKTTFNVGRVLLTVGIAVALATCGLYFYRRSKTVVGKVKKFYERI